MSGNIIIIKVPDVGLSMQKKALKSTISLGIFFLLMTTTYTSFSSVISYISTHSDTQYSFEGQVVLIVNYLVYLIGLINATGITNFKKQFLIAAICYSINYALYFLSLNKDLSLVIGIVGAIVGGYGASILWVSEGGYMTLLLQENNISQNKSGKYMGILNGLIYCQSFFGAIFITFGLGIFGHQIYFAILTSTGMLAFAFCLYFVDPLSINKSQHQQLNEEKHDDTYQIKPVSKTSCKQLKNVINFYPKMKHLIAPMLLDGVIMGFISTAFIKFLPQNMADGLHLGYLLMVAGVGAVIGAFLAGYLTDKIKTTQVGICIILFTILTMTMSFLVFYYKFETIMYALTLGFMWGISFNALESWLFVCCSKIYKGKIQSYAIVKQMHTFSYILFQVHMILTNQQLHYNVLLTILISLCILSLISCKMLSNPSLQSQGLQQGSPDELK